MKEHIKKFPSIASTDGHIIDEPFISEVVVPNSAPLLIRCTSAGKMLKVISGEVVITDAGPELISFTVIREATGDEWNFQCEEGMTWNDIANSEIYNPNGTILRGRGALWSDSNRMYIENIEWDDYSIYDSTKGEYGDNVDPEDIIKPIQYLCWGAND